MHVLISIHEGTIWSMPLLQLICRQGQNPYQGGQQHGAGCIFASSSDRMQSQCEVLNLAGP